MQPKGRKATVETKPRKRTRSVYAILAQEPTPKEMASACLGSIQFAHIADRELVALSDREFDLAMEHRLRAAAKFIRRHAGKGAK